MPEGPALGVELRFEARAEHSCLHPRQARDVVDLDHRVHLAHVDGEDGALLAARRFETLGDVGATSERNDHDVVGHGRRHDRDDVVFGVGVHDHVRQATKVAPANTYEVAQALAVRVHHALARLRGDLIGAQQFRERGCECLVHSRGADRERVEVDHRVARTVEVDPDLLADERCEVGLVFVGERHLLVAPTPPFHVLHHCLLLTGRFSGQTAHLGFEPLRQSGSRAHGVGALRSWDDRIPDRDDNLAPFRPPLSLGPQRVRALDVHRHDRPFELRAQLVDAAAEPSHRAVVRTAALRKEHDDVAVLTRCGEVRERKPARGAPFGGLAELSDRHGFEAQRSAQEQAEPRRFSARGICHRAPEEVVAGGREVKAAKPSAADMHEHDGVEVRRVVAHDDESARRELLSPVHDEGDVDAERDACEALEPERDRSLGHREPIRSLQTISLRLVPLSHPREASTLEADAASVPDTVLVAVPALASRVRPSDR